MEISIHKLLCNLKWLIAANYMWIRCSGKISDALMICHWDQISKMSLYINLNDGIRPTFQNDITCMTKSFKH